jgi:hypothetical protein
MFARSFSFLICLTLLAALMLTLGAVGTAQRAEAEACPETGGYGIAAYACAVQGNVIVRDAAE